MNSPALVVMALADDEEEGREELAQALSQLLPQWDGEEYPVREAASPGPNFASSDTYWRGNGLVMPSLSEFVSPDSFLIFKLVLVILYEVLTSNSGLSITNRTT